MAHTDATLRLRFLGANKSARMVGLDRLPGKSNYLLGNDRAKWQSNVPSFGRVRYEALYPGIDLVYYGNHGRLEYDFDVAPGASPQRIRLDFDGAWSLDLDKRGDLLIHLPGGVLRQRKPVAYQLVGGARRMVPAEYVLLEDDQVGFELTDYDGTRPLIIDPVLDYATYLGGELFDYAWDVAVDGAGDAYVVGATRSTRFPTTTLAYDSSCGTDGLCNGGWDSFILKLDRTGDSLVYATYLGGSADEMGLGVAVDDAGYAYVVGSTGSTDFPTTSAGYDGTCGNGGSLCSDAFVVKLNPVGDALVYATYLGGDGGESATGVAVDGTGRAYATGTTYSADFPTTEQAYDRVCGANGDCGIWEIGPDAFIAQFSAMGDTLLYSSYLGGSRREMGNAIADDAAGHAYVSGATRSADFPTTTRLYEPNCLWDSFVDNCETEMYVAKVDPGAQFTDSLAFAALLGGAGLDQAGAITVDTVGNMYMTGGTVANDFPTTPDAYDRGCAGDVHCYNSGDAFVVKINPALTGPSALLYGSYLGGGSVDRGMDLAIDGQGTAYVTGFTISGNFPVTEGAIDELVDGEDSFVAVLNLTGVVTPQLLYSTYLGGRGDDQAVAIALVDPEGSVYVAGGTSSTDFPTTASAYDRDCGGGDICEGGWDAFLARFVIGADLGLAKHSTPSFSASGATLTYTLVIT
ncbi:MAG TPA: SBBP repeat-containing protein, partial [Ardenticatenaceae bacterium]|nr:SBBP repeat-containing protein [Ardenticatenaceae bacterium]